MTAEVFCSPPGTDVTSFHSGGKECQMTRSGRTQRNTRDLLLTKLNTSVLLDQHTSFSTCDRDAEQSHFCIHLLMANVLATTPASNRGVLMIECFYENGSDCTGLLTMNTLRTDTYEAWYPGKRQLSL